ALGEGWSALPLRSSAADAAAPLQICVLVRDQPDPVQGHFHVLGSTLDAQVFLGCIRDQGRQILGWIELWVQTPADAVDVLIAQHQSLDKASQSHRWQRMTKAMERSQPSAAVRTGWESTSPGPFKLDLTSIQTKNKRKPAGEIIFNPHGGPVLVRRH